MAINAACSICKYLQKLLPPQGIFNYQCVIYVPKTQLLVQAGTIQYTEVDANNNPTLLSFILISQPDYVTCSEFIPLGSNLTATQDQDT